MAAGMPELGSKISLISKADIRYEGRLFTVDPQECTIALSSVRSFGTEDRDTQYAVPAQSQVYDYILFRGRDIKDIRVVNNAPHPQPLNDPAIMQLSVPPTLGTQQYQHPLLGHVGHNPYGSFISMGGLTTQGAAAAPGLQATTSDLKPGGSGGGGDMASIGKPSELIMSSPHGASGVASGGVDLGIIPPHTATSVMSPPPLPSHPAAVGDPARPKDRSGSVLDLISGGASGAGAVGAASRSTTPASIGSRKSISVDQSTQAGASQRDNRRHVKPIQPPRNYQQQQYHQQGNNNNRSRERRNSQNNQDYRPQYFQQQYYQQPQQQQQYQQQNRGSRPQYQNNQGGGGGNGNYGNGNYMQRSGWGNQRGGGGLQRGRGRPRGGSFRPGPSGQMGNRKTTLKFENDYDFEQANTEFEELKNKLSKIKLDEAAGGTNLKSDVSNDANGATSSGSAATAASGGSGGGGDGGSSAELDKKDDSGNETGAGDTEQEEDHEIYYDKTKSFFDQISCEAAERAKGKMQRTDWRKERKLNSETFGIAATRRGNYRGRPGYRGGYRGGYRTGGYKQSNQRRSNDQQNTQQQVKP